MHGLITRGNAILVKGFNIKAVTIVHIKTSDSNSGIGIN
jgi:hypothetical protein